MGFAKGLYQQYFRYNGKPKRRKGEGLQKDFTNNTSATMESQKGEKEKKKEKMRKKGEKKKVCKRTLPTILPLQWKAKKEKRRKKGEKEKKRRKKRRFAKGLYQQYFRYNG